MGHLGPPSGASVPMDRLSAGFSSSANHGSRGKCTCKWRLAKSPERGKAWQRPPAAKKVVCVFGFLVLVNRRRYFLFVWLVGLFVWFGLVEFGFDLMCECECPLR